MFHEDITFCCSQCNHAQFNSKIQLSKHISDHHRCLTSIVVNGVSYTLAAREGSGKYLCPQCDREIASMSTLRRHMAQNCQGSAPAQVRQETRPAVPDAGPDAIPEQETAKALNLEEPRTLDDIGFTYENTWQVAICNLCHFVVDKAMVIEHLASVHALEVPSANAVLLVLRMHRLRPHLAIIWDDAIEDQLDESDDESQGIQLFNPPAFRPGSAPLQGIPVQDGFKCQLCEQSLRQVCVTSKEGMRTHYKRHHKAQAVEYYSVQVQALYGRSKTQSQLRYVQVTPSQTGDATPLSTFGIPDDIHSVPGHNSAVAERKDLNQFGVKFQGYTLLDIVDLSELGGRLHKTEDDSFEILKRLCLRLLEASREDTRAGFQPMLGKVMVGESEKDYFCTYYLCCMGHAAGG